MKKFLIKVGGWSLAVVIFLLCYEVAFRNIPNTYRQKSDFMREHGAGIEVLILGSSHTFYALNPLFFDKAAFNLANSSQDLHYDYLLLKQHIADMTALQYVILPISYFTWDYDLEHFDLTAWRKRKYHIYMGTDLPWNVWQQRLECLNVLEGSCWDYYVRGKDHVVSDSLGFGTNHRLAQRDSLWRSGGKLRAWEHSYLKNGSVRDVRKVRNENVKYFAAMLELCQQHHVRLLLLTLPAWETYRTAMDKEQWTDMKRLTDSLVRKYGLDYFDGLDSEEFGEEDFYDCDHLNENGAEKMSKIVNRWIQGVVSKREFDTTP